jgi:hypothetical protein
MYTVATPCVSCCVHDSSYSSCSNHTVLQLQPSEVSPRPSLLKIICVCSAYVNDPSVQQCCDSFWPPTSPAARARYTSWLGQLACAFTEAGSSACMREVGCFCLYLAFLFLLGYSAAALYISWHASVTALRSAAYVGRTASGIRWP